MSLCAREEKSFRHDPSHSLLDMVAAPWRFAFRPRRAAECFVQGRTGSVAASYAVAMVVLAASSVTHYVIHDAIKTQTGLGLFDPPVLAEGPVPDSDRPYRVWDSVQKRDVPYRAVFVFVLTPFITTVLAVFSAWLWLPLAHGGGSAWDSFLHGLRAVVSGAGFLVLVSNAAAGGFHLWHAHFAKLTIDEVPGVVVLYILGFPTLTTVPVWFVFAMRAVRVHRIEPLRASRCEGCGYDLTHQSPSGLCTECGLAIEESLSPTKRRTLRPWRRGDGREAWLKFSIQSLAGLKQYRRMMMREPTLDNPTFARVHYVLIVVGAWLWIGSCYVVNSIINPGFSPKFGLAAMLFLALFGGFPALLVVLVGWFIHRLVGAVVSTYWFARGMFPDPSYAERVIGRESAFLWLLCLFNGTLITSFMFFDDWITQAVGWRFWNMMLGMPTEPALIFVGNAALCIWWMVRMHRAFLAVRWANF